MAKDIKVTEVVVVDGKPIVRGTVGEVAFEAATKQWGSKMLMNVAAEGLDRGTRIAIASVNHETESREPLRLELDLLKKCGNQIIRHVVNRAESDVFQRLRCRTLSRARQPREQYDLVQGCRCGH